MGEEVRNRPGVGGGGGGGGAEWREGESPAVHFGHFSAEAIREMRG